MYGLTGSFPDILWDGYQNKDLLVDGKMPLEFSICIANSGVKLLNADLPNGSKNVTDNTATHLCELPKLPGVSLSFD